MCAIHSRCWPRMLHSRGSYLDADPVEVALANPHIEARCVHCGVAFVPLESVGQWACARHPGTLRETLVGNARRLYWSCCNFFPHTVCTFTTAARGCLPADHTPDPGDSVIDTIRILPAYHIRTNPATQSRFTHFLPPRQAAVVTDYTYDTKQSQALGGGAVVTLNWPLGPNKVNAKNFNITNMIAELARDIVNDERFLSSDAHIVQLRQQEAELAAANAVWPVHGAADRRTALRADNTDDPRDQPSYPVSFRVIRRGSDKQDALLCHQIAVHNTLAGLPQPPRPVDW